MIADLCIRLPYLHPGLNPGDGAYPQLSGHLKYFWSGHAKMDDSSIYWQPGNLPFSQQEASLILASLKEQKLEDLERIRLLFEQGLHAEERRFRSEMADIANFAISSDRATHSLQDLEMALKQAQVNLIWLWLQEENYLELDYLTDQCTHAERRLLDQVRELDESTPFFSAGALTASPALLPDWRLVAINAALFINPEIPLLVEGAMREELEEELDFTDLPEDRVNGLIRECITPLWKLAGISQSSAAKSPLARIWNTERRLLAMEV